MNEHILPIIVAIIAAVPGLIAIFKQARRDRATAIRDENEAAGKISASALELIQPYRDRVKELEAEVNELRLKVDELEERVDHLNSIKRGAKRLESQVKSLGATPVFHVPDTGELTK